MRKILDSDVGHIRTLLTTIDVHHRHARSINFLGTALKIVAGTPDFDDFEKIKFGQQNLIDSQDKQIIINTKMQEKINQLTDTVNIIIKDSKKENIDTGHLYETLLARDRIIISELETLMLAKIRIVNPAILDSNDVKNIINEASTNITITDLMQVAYVKVLLDNKFLHFIIKYPKPIVACKRITLFPVQHNGTTFNFAGDNNVADCGNQVLAIGNCNTTLTSTFCRELPEPTCAQQLHSGGIAHCNTRPSHLEPLSVIDDGVIIVNDETAVIKTSEGTETTVTGTFLLTFDKEVKINDPWYKNHKNTVRKFPDSAASPLLNIITGHQEILSLAYLQRLSIENLRYIGEIEGKLVTRPALSGLAMVVVFLICYASFKLYQRQMRIHQQHSLQAVIEDLKKPEHALHLSEGGVNTIMQLQSGC